MAQHTYTNNGEPMTKSQAQQKMRDIQSLNAKVGARGWTQKVVPYGNGYKVVENSPCKKK